jgi:Protein of unknown function (DUF5674)
MPMEFIEVPITRLHLEILAKERFGDLVKAVIDIKKGIMVIGGELHADEESLMLDRGSLQSDLWGINLYPANLGDDFIEFDSMINLRPSQGNRSRDVLDLAIRKKIIHIIKQLVR